eukprot:541354_1
MALITQNSPYYRYLSLSLYSSEIFIVLIILCIELKTFYYAFLHRQTVQVTIQESKDKPVTSDTSNPTKKAPTTNNKSESKLTFILPMLSYTFYITTALCGNLSILGVKGCRFSVYIGPTCWFIAKMFMYLLFIYKSYVVYSDSAFAYNNKILLILVTFIVLYTACIAIINLITMEIGIMHDSNNITVCYANASPILVIITVLFDLSINTLCCYVFVRPLMILNNREINGQKNRQSTRMYRMISKCSVLTFVAATTTFVLLGMMAATGINSIIAIDIAINCICIALFNKYYDFYYQKICFGVIKLCNKVCSIKK